MERLRGGDRDVAYIDVGDGAPLVCIHGSLSDCRVWTPILELLSSQYRSKCRSTRSAFTRLACCGGDGQISTANLEEARIDLTSFVRKKPRRP
ncbi:pimeloyl-ACP methyl ester carboxylesterase [Bradyrhizobium sp. USDA 326]